MPTLFRIDEFARTADAALTGRDLTRFFGVGFDLLPSAPAAPVTGLRFGAASLIPAGFGQASLIPAGFGAATLED